MFFVFRAYDKPWPSFIVFSFFGRLISTWRTYGDGLVRDKVLHSIDKVEDDRTQRLKTARDNILRKNLYLINPAKIYSEKKINFEI